MPLGNPRDFSGYSPQTRGAPAHFDPHETPLSSPRTAHCPGPFALFRGSAACSGGTFARLRAVKQPSRPLAIVMALSAALLSALVSAPLALAENGVGIAGPTTDKTITFFCFGVIAFFAVLVIVLSIVQGRLEARKERRKFDLQRYG